MARTEWADKQTIQIGFQSRSTRHLGSKLLFAIQPGIKREARRAIASPSGGRAIWVLFQAVAREDVLGWD